MELTGLSINLEIPDLWQQDAVRALKAGRDVILDAPTGAGKTWVFELLIKSGVLKGQAVYTVPTRALANDKWREWKQKGFKVGIATGDLAVDVDAPVLVATLETQRERFLTGDGPALLVIDEYQMIGDPMRGLNYELSVTLSPPDTQLLLMSGSVANPADIAAWMDRLGRDVELVQTHERPVPLEDIPVHGMARHAPGNVRGFWQRLATQALLSDYAPLLIFAPQRKAAEKIAQKISEGLPAADPVPLTQEQTAALGPKLARMVRNRVAYHHSGLSYAQRAAIIEPLAKAGHLRVIVATTGLAAGINFSVRSVYVADTQYQQGAFQREIAPDELLQMFGRAGRRGLDEVGYVLSTESSPRLSSSRPKHLKRTNEIDWPTLLRVMHRARNEGESPFEAAVRVCRQLFSRQHIRLGFEPDEDEREYARPVEDKIDGASLFGLGPMRKEVRNSARAWEKEDPAGKGRTSLEETLVFHVKKGWKPALESGAFMQDRVSSLGRLCKLRNGDRPAVYGAEMVIGNVVDEKRVLLTKRWRKLAELTKPEATKLREELPEIIARVLGRTDPGISLDRLETRQNVVVALLDLAHTSTDAYRDSRGAWLIEPKKRTVSVEFDTSYVDEKTRESINPPINSAAWAWRKLGLVDPEGAPTRRGMIASFFQSGEGMAVAAALEDETYPVEDLVLHLANLRAGHRFENEMSEGGASERLAASCRAAYGPVDYTGYLHLGLPVHYGEGAAEVIELILAGEHDRKRDEILGQGDVERAMVEWLSLLRHIRHAPDLEDARWMALKAVAKDRLHTYGKEHSANLNVPVIEGHVLHREVRHRISRHSSSHAA